MNHITSDSDIIRIDNNTENININKNISTPPPYILNNVTNALYTATRYIQTQELLTRTVNIIGAVYQLRDNNLFLLNDHLYNFICFDEKYRQLKYLLCLEKDSDTHFYVLQIEAVVRWFIDEITNHFHAVRQINNINASSEGLH